MPGEMPRPWSRRSLFIKTAGDQRGECVERARGIGAGRGKLDGAAGARGQHHEAHDGAPRDRGAGLGDGDLGVIFPGELDETRGGARVQAALVEDRDGAPHFRRPGGWSVGGRLHHYLTSASNCDATLMYLRPASWAPRTASARLSLCRRLASLISIGRLTPAMTSTLALSMIEIARFEGVPPNMSVSSTTPFPALTSSTERRMSCRRRSMSSSGPMQTAAMLRCGPTTCSSAEMNSAAKRPWVTRTIPIMRCPSRDVRAPRRRRQP